MRIRFVLSGSICVIYFFLGKCFSADLYRTLESRVYSEVFVLGRSIGYFDIDFFKNGERLKFKEISRLIKEANRRQKYKINIKSI